MSKWTTKLGLPIRAAPVVISTTADIIASVLGFIPFLDV
jgi:hypothetical protein